MYTLLERQSDIFMTLSPSAYELAGYYTDPNKTVFNDISTLNNHVVEIKNVLGSDAYWGAGYQTSQSSSVWQDIRQLRNIVGYTQA
eukprot:scaffold55097_cov40-Tisochrysis_lutea.AAC.1